MRARILPGVWPLILACASPSALDGGEAAGALRGLLAPLPRAMALPPDRDALHAHLAASLAGELLTREYVEAWVGLRRMAEAGAALTVESVEVEEARRVGRAPLRVEATWTVTGTLRHAAHAHRRASRHRAVFTLAGTPEGLRIVDIAPRDHRRLPLPEAPGEALGLLELAR